LYVDELNDDDDDVIVNKKTSLCTFRTRCTTTIRR